MYLDFNRVENLAVVYTNNGADHLGNDNHITQVSLNNLRLLANADVALRGVQTLEKSHRLSLHTTVSKATASTSIDELDKRGTRQLEQVLKINTAVGELAEGALLTSAFSVLDGHQEGGEKTAQRYAE